MWDIRKPGFLLAFDQHTSSSNSNSVLSNNNINNSIAIHTPSTPPLSRQFSGRSIVGNAHVGAVTGLLFSHDGRFLVSCGTDGKIRSWDALIGKNTLVIF